MKLNKLPSLLALCALCVSAESSPAQGVLQLSVQISGTNTPESVTLAPGQVLGIGTSGTTLRVLNISSGLSLSGSNLVAADPRLSGTGPVLNLGMVVTGTSIPFALEAFDAVNDQFGNNINGYYLAQTGAADNATVDSQTLISQYDTGTGYWYNADTASAIASGATGPADSLTVDGNTLISLLDTSNGYWYNADAATISGNSTRAGEDSYGYLFGTANDNLGVVLGSYTTVGNGGAAIGYNATASSGGAVGYNTFESAGGGAVGVSAYAGGGGGAVGNSARATTGFAGGNGAEETGGGANFCSGNYTGTGIAINAYEIANNLGEYTGSFVDDSSVPTNPSLDPNVVGYIHTLVNGTPAWIPYYH